MKGERKYREIKKDLILKELEFKRVEIISIRGISLEGLVVDLNPIFIVIEDKYRGTLFVPISSIHYIRLLPNNNKKEVRK